MIFPHFIQHLNFIYCCCCLECIHLWRVWNFTVFSHLSKSLFKPSTVLALQFLSSLGILLNAWLLLLINSPFSIIFPPSFPFSNYFFLLSFIFMSILDYFQSLSLTLYSKIFLNIPLIILHTNMASFLHLLLSRLYIPPFLSLS